MRALSCKAPLETPLQVKKAKFTKHRGRRGFGGPWRAYVRAMSLGQKGRPSLKKLGETFRADVASGSVVMQRLAAQGRAATLAGKHEAPRAGHSSFGPTGRQLKRRALHDLRTQLAALAAGADMDTRAVAVGQQLATTDISIDACVSLARSALRQGMAQDRKRLGERDAALRAFEEGEGKAAAEMVVHHHPWLAGTELTAVPTPIGVLLRASPVDTERLHMAAGWAYSSKASNLSTHLQESWGSMHKTILEEDCPAMPGRAAGPTQCRVAGKCLCSEAGKKLVKFKNRFLAAMKKTFQKGSLPRDLLQDGSILVHFKGAPARGDYEAIVGQDNPFCDRRLHIGLMKWSPYKPTFMEVEEVSAPDGAADVEGRLWVKAIVCCGTHVSVGAPPPPRHWPICSKSIHIRSARMWPNAENSCCNRIIQSLVMLHDLQSPIEGGAPTETPRQPTSSALCSKPWMACRTTARWCCGGTA